MENLNWQRFIVIKMYTEMENLNCRKNEKLVKGEKMREGEHHSRRMFA